MTTGYGVLGVKWRKEKVISKNISCTFADCQSCFHWPTKILWIFWGHLLSTWIMKFWLKLHHHEKVCGNEQTNHHTFSSTHQCLFPSERVQMELAISGAGNVVLLQPYPWTRWRPSQWRRNGRDGVSNQQPHKVNSPHKVPVTRKMFPFDDVIMLCSISNE